MRPVWEGATAVVLLTLAGAAQAQSQDFTAERAAVAECFEIADAAFETQLSGDLDETLTGDFRTVAYNAASVCDAMAYAICDPLDQSDACYGALAQDMQTRRRAIVATLPAEISDVGENGFYVQFLPEFTPATLSSACGQSGETEAQGACFFLSERDVAQILYYAWRMARVSVDVPLVGYAPVSVPPGTDGVEWYMSKVRALVAALPAVP